MWQIFLLVGEGGGVAFLRREHALTIADISDSSTIFAVSTVVILLPVIPVSLISNSLLLLVLIKTGHIKKRASFLATNLALIDLFCTVFIGYSKRLMHSILLEMDVSQSKRLMDSILPEIDVSQSDFSIQKFLDAN